MADAPSSLYPYDPSLAAAIIFTVLYWLLAAWHGHLQLTYPWLYNRSAKTNHGNSSNRPSCRRHRHTIPTAIATVLSTLGFVHRAVSTRHVSSIGIYATSSTLIVVSPIFVCASLYLLLSRLIRRCLPAVSATSSRDRSPQSFYRIPARWLGRLFIISDVFSFLTQAGGTSIAAGGDWEGDSAEIGTNVLLFGLSLQLATFTVFIFTVYRFLRRVRLTTGGGVEPPVKSLLVGVAIASLFVEIRSVFRVVEFALGVDGYPFQNEWPLYVLEAVPMLVAFVALAWWHPVKLLPEGMLPEKQKDAAANEVELALEGSKGAGQSNRL